MTIPALFFIVYGRLFSLDYQSSALWRVLSIASISLIVLLFLFPGASTPIDRIALYLIPVQLFVYSHLPRILNENWGVGFNITISFISALYFVVLVIWLAFSSHAERWLPYQFYPLSILNI
jgi:hypothetical protein